MSTLKEKRRENDLYLHRSHLEDQARAQTELMREANRLAEKQAAAGSGGASTSSGDPVVGIVVLLVLAVIVAIIAIVVTYWAEILFAGLAVLAFHYRKPISRLVRRIAAACSGTQAEPERLPPLEKSPTEESMTAARLCGNCRRPNIPPAPFCRHCGSHIAALPVPALIPATAATPPRPPAIQLPAPPPAAPRIAKPATDHQTMTVDGPQYRICGRQTDPNHPDCVYYALEGQDGRRYGISVRSDGFRGPLIDLHTGATVKPAAEPIKPGARLNIPALCSRTGQVFIYVCEYHRHGSDSYWLVASTKIPQDRAAASASASARMADVHSSFRITSDARCPYCQAKTFGVCPYCRTVSCDSTARYQNGKEQNRCEGCHTWFNVVIGEGILGIHALEQQAVNERTELVPADSRSASVYRGSSE